MSVKEETANERQVGGTHYQAPIQHWDFVLMHGMPYMEAQIFKYVLRHKKKNGIQDLEKARHFLDKLIEWERAHPDTNQPLTMNEARATLQVPPPEE